MTVLNLSRIFRGPYYTPTKPGLPCHFKSEIVLDVTDLYREAGILFDEKWVHVCGCKAETLKAEYTEETLWRVAGLVSDWLIQKAQRDSVAPHSRLAAKVKYILAKEKQCIPVGEAGAVIKGLYCPIMDLAEAKLRLRDVQKIWTKAAIRQENKVQGFHFFDAKTMKANGDTMRNFQAEYSLTKGIYLKRLSNGQCWMFNTETGRLTLEKELG